MKPEELLKELMDNIEELPSHNQDFVRSVNAYYERTGFVSEDQAEWLQIFYEQIEKQIGDD